MEDSSANSCCSDTEEAATDWIIDRSAELLSNTGTLTIQNFIRRSLNLKSFKDVESLRQDAIDAENLYRELFSRKRDNWEVPEIDDPYHFLVDVYASTETFNFLPKFEDDVAPRCFELDEDKRHTAGELGIVPTRNEFDISWDCLTEGLLRFLDWENVCAAGGAVAGCLAPLPSEVGDVTNFGAKRVVRREYFHDEFLPGSDIDLFLYGIDETQAEKKLMDIYEAVQAACPYTVRAFRSAYAITLVSQYPFRHVQIVLRLYNSPSEVLMGFDVDSCAVGYDGEKVLVCPRTAMAIVTQSNVVDMSRRSPSYEMRLSKYATRGFEVVVPSLNRDRVDPFVYEKRFDQATGLSRLLLLEKLRSPEERLRYRLEGQLKTKGTQNWRLQRRLYKLLEDRWNLDRADGVNSILPPPPTGGAEASNYSTIFLPWGPNWTADKCEQQTRTKDRLLNKIKFAPDGRVVKSSRGFKIHVCAVGTMEEVIADPFPDDPPFPNDVDSEALETAVYGKLTWLKDNPGRQQIGSFHPITDDDWTDGAYFSHAAEALTKAVVTNDVDSIAILLSNEESNASDQRDLIASKDFLGRSTLHLAALSQSAAACKLLLEHPSVDGEYLRAHLSDGRTSLHLAAMKGDLEMTRLILEKRQNLAALMVAAESSSETEEKDALVEVLDIDISDWEVKINPLQYAISLGHVEIVSILLDFGASARKVAVQKDQNKSISTLTLLAQYSLECGEVGLSKIQPILKLLLDAGASFAQVDTSGMTCWHHLASSTHPSACETLESFVSVATSCDIDKRTMALDVLDVQKQSALYIATVVGNANVIRSLLQHGATPVFSEEDWEKRVANVLELERGRSRYSHGMGQEAEHQRCPISLAATLVDIPSLKAFLGHDTSLANISIQMPAGYAIAYTQNYYGNHGNVDKISFRPLDILELARLEVSGIGDLSNGRDEDLKQVLKLIDKSELRLTEAKTCRDNAVTASQNDGAVFSYQSFVWALVVEREKEMLEKKKFQKEQYKIPEDDKYNKEDAINQIDEAYKIVQESGGQRQIQEFPSKEKGSPNFGCFGRFNHNNNQDCELHSLLDDYAQMQMQIGHHAFGHQACGYNTTQEPAFSKGAKKNMTDFMAAVLIGNMDLMEKKVEYTTLCVHNRFGAVSPMFLAVFSGKINALRIIFEASTRQFHRYSETQKELILKEKTQRKELIKNTKKYNVESKNMIKDQVKRLNNLDIAAGDMPENEGPTPDEIRLRLEAAEASAIEQTSILVDEPIKNKDTEDEWVIPHEPISSSICPGAMLLHRSIILPDPHEKGLLKLKNKMKAKFPSFTDEWVRHAVKLRPIELAVIRSDLEMVQELINLSAGIDDKEEVNVGDGVEEIEGNDCSSDEDFSSDEDYSDKGIRKLPLSLTASQLRQQLTGSASRNMDLACMTLIDLAMMMDNVSILVAIISYAREFALPRQAIGVWKTEVDAVDDHVCDEETKRKREEVTKRIKGSDTPTLLQSALITGCKITAQALMMGELDDELLKWIIEKPYTIVKNEEDYEMKGAQEAAAWVSQQVFKSNVTKTELIKRLVGPTAPDTYGRTALFYSPAEWVPEVINSAVQALVSEQNVSESAAKSVFLELRTITDFSVLMATTATGDIVKVKALLKAGSDRSARTRDGKRWGALHMAVKSGNSIPVANDKEYAEGWGNVLEMIEVIIDGATNFELNELLLSPESEFTPLMLAAAQSAHDSTIIYLAKQMTFLAIDGVARSDSDMNSALHLAVKNAINSSGNKGDLSRIRALLDMSASGGLGPSTENAQGVTPLEIALEAALSIWSVKALEYRRWSQVWSQSQNSTLPPETKSLLTDEDVMNHNLPSLNRQIHSLLREMELKDKIQRVPVSFDDVKDNKTNATKRVRTISDKGRTSSGYAVKKVATSRKKPSRCQSGGINQNCDYTAPSPFIESPLNCSSRCASIYSAFW